MSRALRVVPSDDELRRAVRGRYAEIASGGGCCGGSADGAGCCAPGTAGCGGGSSAEFGYSADELARLPEGADLGLGCGNPTALTSLRTGEHVLDLGSGAGIDCFLAARRVGPRGRAIGVDMTPEMLAKARANAEKGGYRNVEFRLGEIEHLPVADASVDVVISNCVINLAPDQSRVYGEAFRVLRPGGRLAVSDVVAPGPTSTAHRGDPARWSSCMSGALPPTEIARRLRRAGFVNVKVELRPTGAAASLRDAASREVVPADIRATKPARRRGSGA